MSIRKVGELLLPSIAYGDAAGLPTEVKSVEAIEAHYGHITHLLPPTDNPYYPGDFPAGTTSDDTQLSVGTAESLLAADGFTIDAQAAVHLRIYQESPRVINFKGKESVRGWGGSTTASMDRLASGVSPHESGQKDGAGNGIIMKMAPLVYWQLARETSEIQRHREYDEFTTMTHDSDLARACTRVHGDILHWVMAHPHASLEELSSFGISVLTQNPTADPNGRVAQALSQPAGSFDQLVERYAFPHLNGHYGFIVNNTLAMAYDVFMTARGNYTRAVFDAVNLGGDSDSIASIAGAMCNAWSSGNFLQPPDFESVQDYERLVKLSREFAQKALRLI